MSTPHLRPVWAEVDLEAIRHNVALLAHVSAPARMCVVVKADGYGHGAPSVAAAALEGGASWLAVALVEEGITLRQAGIEAPVLVLSEPPPEAMADVVAHGLTPTLDTAAGTVALSEVAGGEVGVHVKVDTGMHRVGADPSELAGVLAQVGAAPALRFEGLWTHLAVADGTGQEDREFTALQLQRFEQAGRNLAADGMVPAMTHAANSAAAITCPSARLDMVRCGIAAYGLLPDPGLESALSEAARHSGWTGPLLQPALSLKSRVSHVRRLPGGERPSYGRRRPLPADAIVATIPIGYADGVPRRLGETGGTVLVAGRPRPLAGTVTMDQIMVDCGDDQLSVGDEVVLLGSQGTAAIGAWDWATALGTIAYEVVCGIGARVPRVVVNA